MAVAAADISSADATAIIDSALLDAQSGNTTPVAVHDATLLPDTTNPSAPPPPDETPEQAQLRHAREDMLGKEQADALAQEEAEQAAREATLLGVAEKYLNASKAKASDANVKIGNVPTPGSISTPLILLCIFFFILIQFNGNTRAQWAWKVLTNNAFISASQGASSQSSSQQSSGPNYIPATTQPVPLEVPVPSFSSNGFYGSPY